MRPGVGQGNFAAEKEYAVRGMTAIRRLTAILAADVVGYSKLIGADEGGTLARLKSIWRELIDPEISDHRGRIVKTTGDGLLVEFASVVDALGCATEIQVRMAERNAEVMPNRNILPTAWSKRSLRRFPRSAGCS